MKDIKRILCIVDPTTSVQPAMHRAAWLAQKTGAELDLYICYYNEYLSGERFFDAPSLKKARAEVVERNLEYLEKLAEQARAAGLTVHTNVKWDHPLDEGIARVDINPRVPVAQAAVCPIFAHGVESACWCDFEGGLF